MISLRKPFLNLAVLFTFALGFSQAAHAQNKKFTFDFSGDSCNAMGTLFASPNGDGTYTAFSGSITLPSNSTHVGLTPGTYHLLPIGTTFFDNNIVSPTANPILSFEGVAFGNTGGYHVSLGGDFSPGAYFMIDSQEGASTGSLTFISAAVPELSSMLGFGSFVVLGGLVFLCRRKRDHNSA